MDFIPKSVILSPKGEEARSFADAQDDPSNYLKSSRRVIFIVGPTAVGKSDVAFLLAQQMNGEIISCDAMQVYQEISIATSKPSAVMLRKIPHHLVNVQSAEEEFDVAKFSEMALNAIAGILKKGKVPIITGGSGMYMQVLLDGIFKGGGKDPKVRARLEEEAEVKGNEAMYERLKKVDPAAALKIHSRDRRRVVRALEVYEMMQQPISKAQKSREGLWGKYDIRVFALNRNRAELYDRINERVEEMLAMGLVKEIKSLNRDGLSLTASRVIGVQEIDGHLKGEYDLERVKYLIKMHTRHLAKRQLTWFRKDKRLEWITMTNDDSVEAIAGKIKDTLK